MENTTLHTAQQHNRSEKENATQTYKYWDLFYCLSKNILANEININFNAHKLKRGNSSRQQRTQIPSDDAPLLS